MKDVRILFIGCGILVLVCAFSVRLWSVGHAEPIPTTVEQPAGIPAFTSAAFQTGDAIGSLGPEWTLVRQDVVGDQNIVVLSGARASRETLVRLIGTSSTLLITEVLIDHRETFEDALKETEIHKTQIAGRDGYLVRPASLSGTSGFLIVGSSDALLLQYGDTSFEQTVDWPTTLPQAILSYLQVVSVR